MQTSNADLVLFLLRMFSGRFFAVSTFHLALEHVIREADDNLDEMKLVHTDDVTLLLKLRLTCFYFQWSEATRCDIAI
jgi:hypothetical protein